MDALAVRGHLGAAGGGQWDGPPELCVALRWSGDVTQPLTVPDRGCWEGIRVSALLYRGEMQFCFSEREVFSSRGKYPTGKRAKAKPV